MCHNYRVFLLYFPLMYTIVCLSCCALFITYFAYYQQQGGWKGESMSSSLYNHNCLVEFFCAVFITRFAYEHVGIEDH